MTTEKSAITAAAGVNPPAPLNRGELLNLHPDKGGLRGVGFESDQGVLRQVNDLGCYFKVSYVQ